MKMQEEMRVKKIREGTVIDHIPAGKALKVAGILELNENIKDAVSIVMNVPSKTMGRKDVIKVEGRELSDRDLHRISLIAPNASINKIKDFEVTEKTQVTLPQVFEGILKCPNLNCVTNFEGRSKMMVEETNGMKLRCAYCDRTYSTSELQ